MNIRYRVTLKKEEREELENICRSGKTSSKQFLYSRALLLCDAGQYGPAWKVVDVAEAMGVSSRMIEHLKEKFVEQGLQAALERKPYEKTNREPKFDDAFEAHLVALACTNAPEGRIRWTVRLLAEKVIELNMAPEISHMSVHRILKKTNCSLTAASTGKFHQSKIHHL
jgi:transposase